MKKAPAKKSIDELRPEYDLSELKGGVRGKYYREATAGTNLVLIEPIEKLALDLPERERATLAANLLDSLPGILSDEDEGIAEALRRDAKIEADPAQAISLAELDSHIQGRRG